MLTSPKGACVTINFRPNINTSAMEPVRAASFADRDPPSPIEAAPRFTTRTRAPASLEIFVKEGRTRSFDSQNWSTNVSTGTARYRRRRHHGMGRRQHGGAVSIEYATKIMGRARPRGRNPCPSSFLGPGQQRFRQMVHASFSLVLHRVSPSPYGVQPSTVASSRSSCACPSL